MIFLFEDKEDDQLSCLWRKSFYNNDIRLVYANGNGRLVEKAEELLKENDTIIVLLDTVPANKSIRDIYVALRRLSRKNEFRIIVWNIVCAEYYFIKAFAEQKDLRAFSSTIDISIIRNKESYQEGNLIIDDADKAFTKTFEKFCKLFILKNGGECINVSKAFFCENCSDNAVCRELSIDVKSFMYRREYGIYEMENITVEKAWEFHNKFLMEANNMIETYNKSGKYLEVRLYPVIK